MPFPPAAFIRSHWLSALGGTHALGRPGKMQGGANGDTAKCLDASGSASLEVDDLEQLRECARHVGALHRKDAGWFARVLAGRLQRASSYRPNWSTIYPGLSAEERASRHIAKACRRTALAGALSSAGAQAGELATLLTEGLAAPIGIPAALASVACETVFSAIVQIDLACDLASIYGVPFKVGDAGELAALFDVALRGGAEGDARYAGVLAPNDGEILMRIGRGLAEDALLGLVPFLGVPWSVRKNYRATRRLGESAREYILVRKAVLDVLPAVLTTARLDKILLLEGAWLLATSDDDLTHEEMILLSALTQAIPLSEHPSLERLGFLREDTWLASVARLPLVERRAILEALHTIAGLRGATGAAELRFLRRVGHVMEQTFDFARIDHVRRHALRGAPLADCLSSARCAAAA